MGVYGDRQRRVSGWDGMGWDGMGMVQGTEDMTQGPRHKGAALHTLDIQDENSLDVDVQRRHCRYSPQRTRNIQRLLPRIRVKGSRVIGHGPGHRSG